MIDCEKVQSIIGIGSFQHAANRYHLIIGTPLWNSILHINNINMHSELIISIEYNIVEIIHFTHYVYV